MNSMDLFKAFGYIDDDLLFDAIQGGAQPQPSAGAAPVKQPKNNGPRRGGAKTKTILIGAVAMVLAAAIVCMILYFTGVFGSKQEPIYTGMEISSTDPLADQSSTKTVSYKYGGDYTGKGDDVDKNNPYGSGNTTIEEEAASTLQVVSAGDDIYYANAGEDIYIIIKFDNPDYYKIESFVLYDGTTEIHYADYNFRSDSSFERIIVQLNVGNEGGIKEYTISEILYIDGKEVKNVKMEGDTAVRCGVYESGMTYAEITDETTTLTSISFNVNIVDKYSLISYSDNYYVKAILFDGTTLVNITDLQVGENTVSFTNLSPDKLYQYAIVAYYDDCSGSGAALNYLYSNTVYTPAIVLFDEDSITVDQENITFGYSWYDEVGTITSLTLTGGGETKDIDAQSTRITGLLSNTDYTLTATYKLANGDTSSITLEFTTEAKETPSVEITVTDATVSTLTFNVDYTDTDGVGKITAIALYNGNTLVKSETNLNQVEYTYSGLEAYTNYTLKVSYSYDLNDGVGEQTAEQTLTENTYPLVEINSVSEGSSSVVTEGGTIRITADMNNPSGVTYNSVVVNGETYSAVGTSTAEELIVNISNDGQFAGGTTTLTISQIICTIDGKTYTIDISENNTVEVFIYGELTVENFYVARYNSTSGKYEETSYGLANEQLYYVVSLGNGTKYNIDSITIGGTKYSSSEITLSSDYQTAYIPVYTESVATTLSAIVYSNSYVDSKTKTFNVSAGYFRALSVSEVVEITTAKQLLDVDDNAYYKLMNNIDVSGYENTWVNMNNNLVGVFDGNGYTISGLGAAEDYYNTSLNMGLFNDAEGIIMNLTVEAFYIVTLNITVSGSYAVSVGGLAISSYELYIDNVDVDITASITTYGDVGSITACGICGSVFSTLNVLTNSTVNDNISITVKDGTISDIYVGGLYGGVNVQPYGTAEISDTDVTIKANVTFENASVQSPYLGICMGGIAGSATLYNDFILSNVNINRSLTLTGETSSYANGVYAGRGW